MFIGQSIINKRLEDKKEPKQKSTSGSDDVDFKPQFAQNPGQQPTEPQKPNEQEENARLLDDDNIPNDKKKEAQQEVIKEHAKEDIQNDKKLEDLVAASNKVLFRCSTAAPLNPFPTDITVSLDKVAIVDREFFMNAEIHTFPISDINDVVVRTGIFWSTLHLIIESFQEDPLVINYLKTDDAIKARRLIQGLKICKDEGLKLTELAEDEIVQKVEEIGRAREP